MNLVFSTMADLREAATQAQARAERDCRREFPKLKPRARELRLIDPEGNLIEVQEWTGRQRQIVEAFRTSEAERVHLEGGFETPDGDWIDGGEWDLLVAYGSRNHLMIGDTVQVRQSDGSWEDGWTYDREFTDGNVIVSDPKGEGNIGVKKKDVRLQRIQDRY